MQGSKQYIYMCVFFQNMVPTYHITWFHGTEDHSSILLAVN
jgi:hypothetical protein